MKRYWIVEWTELEDETAIEYQEECRLRFNFSKLIYECKSAGFMKVKTLYPEKSPTDRHIVEDYFD